MTKYLLLQWEQGEWRAIGFPQMKYPNMFDTLDKALDAAWGLYEGYSEVKIRRTTMQMRPAGWRLPSILSVVEIQVPGSPYPESLPKVYNS